MRETPVYPGSPDHSWPNKRNVYCMRCKKPTVHEWKNVLSRSGPRQVHYLLYRCTDCGRMVKHKKAPPRPA